MIYVVASLVGVLLFAVAVLAYVCVRLRRTDRRLRWRMNLLEARVEGFTTEHLMIARGSLARVAAMERHLVRITPSQRREEISR